MKKSLITAAAIAIIGAAGYAVINSNNQQREFSELELANIEALTEGEGDSTNSKTCWHTITSKEGSKVLFCGTCSWIDNSTYSWISSSDKCVN